MKFKCKECGYTVDILGTEYTIEYKPASEIAQDMGCEAGECGGYCSPYAHKIIVAQYEDKPEERQLMLYNLRHEIVHAFLFESGLWSNSNPVDGWAANEEMVDWIALQGPKIYQAWCEVEAL